MYMSDHLINGFLYLIGNQDKLYRLENTACKLSLVPRNSRDYEADRLRMTIPTVEAKRIGLLEGYYIQAGFDFRIMKHGFFSLRRVDEEMVGLAPRGSGLRKLREFENRGKFRPDLPFNMGFDPRYIEDEWDARIYAVSGNHFAEGENWYLVRFPIGLIVDPRPKSIYNMELGVSNETRVGKGERNGV